MFLFTLLQWQKHGQHGLSELLLWFSSCVQMLISPRVPGADYIVSAIIMSCLCCSHIRRCVECNCACIHLCGLVWCCNHLHMPLSFRLQATTVKFANRCLLRSQSGASTWSHGENKICSWVRHKQRQPLYTTAECGTNASSTKGVWFRWQSQKEG